MDLSIVSEDRKEVLRKIDEYERNHFKNTPRSCKAFV